MPQFCMLRHDACLCTSRQSQATCSSAELSESAWITQLEALRGQEHQHSCALQVASSAGCCCCQQCG